MKDYITEDQTDRIRWIDTSAMICDPLTKAGPKGFADRLNSTMRTGELSLEPSVESQMKKLKNQKLRQQRAAEKLELKEREIAEDAHDEFDDSTMLDYQ